MNKKKDDVLSEETLRAAIDSLNNDMPIERSLISLHPSAWEDTKKVFNLSENDMTKYFIKTTFIEEGI